jgi:flagellar hook assembly protein FlgD
LASVDITVIPDSIASSAPNKLNPELGDNLLTYPNPFSSKITISYNLPEASNAEIAIYNNAGKKVETLVSKKQSAGTFNVEWDAIKFSSGIYFCSLKTSTGISQKEKIILLK